MLFVQFTEQFNARLKDMQSKAKQGNGLIPITLVESQFALLRQDLHLLERDVMETTARRGISCELSPKM